jgi:hypothetical protein
MMHHRIQIMMHREFMQLYASHFDELKTLSMFARVNGSHRSFRHRVKLADSRLSCVSQYGPCANPQVVLMHAMVGGLKQTSVRQSPATTEKSSDRVPVRFQRQIAVDLGCEALIDPCRRFTSDVDDAVVRVGHALFSQMPPEIPAMWACIGIR